MNKQTDFCTVCRKETEYTLQKVNIKAKIKSAEYTFSVTVAVCSECGGEMSLPGMINKNVQEIDTQYRTYENIVSVDEIKKLMEICKAGESSFNFESEIGEATIARYLSGQMPSKKHSDIIRKALDSLLTGKS